MKKLIRILQKAAQRWAAFFVAWRDGLFDSFVKEFKKKIKVMYQPTKILLTGLLLTLNFEPLILQHSIPKPELNWADSAGGDNTDCSNSVTTDRNGNIYIAGYFISPGIKFGTTTLTKTNPKEPTSNMFLSKYSPGGKLLWARDADGFDTRASSICTDYDGNVYVTGFFLKSATFGTITLDGEQMNMFIAKYDSDGNILWARCSAGGGIAGKCVVSDKTGDIYVTGFFNDSTTFGTTSLKSNGYDDIFITKYNTNGALLWAKASGGIGSDEGMSIAVDSSKNIFVTGFTCSPDIDTYSINHSGSYDMCLVKYDSSGNTIWVKTAGGKDDDRGSSLTIGSNGNIYM